MSERLVIPEPKYCPCCGSKNLHEKFDGWSAHALKTGYAFGECADCGTHFGVSTYHEFTEDGEDDQ